MSGKKNKNDKPLKNYANSLNLHHIDPRTDNQQKVFDSYDDGQHLLMYGSAGTGKSLLAMYLALEDVLVGKQYNKVIVVRSIVPSRDIGFLPGNQTDKAKIYELPYQQICSLLFERDDAYSILRQKHTLEFETTSFMRGLTFNDCCIIVDEIQNCTIHELSSVITRTGDNCRLFFCGDNLQDDLADSKGKQQTGFHSFLKIIKTIEKFSCIEFEHDDIQRSDLVKKYLIAKEKLKL